MEQEEVVVGEEVDAPANNAMMQLTPLSMLPSTSVGGRRASLSRYQVSQVDPFDQLVFTSVKKEIQQSCRQMGGLPAGNITSANRVCQYVQVILVTSSL